MLAGELMNAGGISKRIVAFALAWVGHIRGGLGLVAVFALGADGRDLRQRRRRHGGDRHAADPDDAQAGYDMPRSAGLIAAGGVIAPVIPPSIGCIMFGVVANVSIGKLFLAGFFPAC
jgi:TRAP-type C4-dicarboxylate transport system permease large subunit